jgi:TusA-related sulfurtransferase
MHEIEADVVVDCLGLFCPEPILRTRLAIDSAEVGQIIEVIADDPSAENDIKAWAKHTGHEILKIDKVDGEFHFFIRKVK